MVAIAMGKKCGRGIPRRLMAHKAMVIWSVFPRDGWLAGDVGEVDLRVGFLELGDFRHTKIPAHKKQK